MKVKILIGIGLLGVTSAFAQFPPGQEILDRIDANMSAKTRFMTSKMVIHGRRDTRTIESRSWIEGKDKSFSEYLAPAREKGTKMLKRDDMLWMYSPSTDRIIQISGHMLRQSVMGSDLSYEDMMEDPKLINEYDAVVTGEDTVYARPCWVVELTAKKEDVSYQSRKLWVDKERNLPLKEELYAKSGTLLKRLELTDIVQTDGRWYPRRFLFKDMLKTGDGTEFLIETIKFNVDIPPYLFNKAALRK